MERINESPRVAAVVVTYNRKECLLECLRAIERQTLRPDTVYIVDNASTDGTREAVDAAAPALNIVYLRLEENIGGAGGFYTGLKTAFECGEHDCYWLMDDDGVPAENCLEHMIPYLKDNEYVAPLVLALEDRTKLAFGTFSGSEIKNDAGNFVQSRSRNGIIEDYSSPFNGILLRHSAVHKAGYPKKELFIWGDELEYQARLKSHGIRPVTVVDAVHLHPMNRMAYKTLFNKYSIVDMDSSLRTYCYYRNCAYRLKKFGSAKENLKFLSKYIGYFLFSKHFDIKGLGFYCSAVVDGYRESFGKHKRFLKH